MTLFAQVIQSGKAWCIQDRKDEDVDDWSNPYIELLTTRLKTGRWKVTEKTPEMKRLIEAKTDDTSVTTAVCFAHELWGTHLLKPRLAVRVDTILGCSLTAKTTKSVDRVMQTIEAFRPKRELMAAFADPAPFSLDGSDERVLHFSTRLLHVLAIGPVILGSDEHSRLLKFAPVIKMLSRISDPCPSHKLDLKNVEWCMEAYRLSVQVMQCRYKKRAASTTCYATALIFE